MKPQELAYIANMMKARDGDDLLNFYQHNKAVCDLPMDEPNLKVVWGYEIHNGYDNENVGVVISKAMLGEERMIGMVWRVEECWYAIMGSCYLSTFPTWRTAANGVELAYYG